MDTSSTNDKNFLQLYFLDGTKKVEEKLTTEINSSNDNKRVEIDKLLNLHKFIKEKNPYVNIFNQANYFFKKHQSENEVVVHKFCVPTYDVTFEAGKGNFEAPTAPIEMGLIPYNGDTFKSYRDIRISRSNEFGFRSMSENNRLYDPFYYTLMFPYGYEGYDANKKISDKKNKSESNKEYSGYTVQNFYQYLLQIRENDKHPLWKFGKLFQRYIVDQDLKIENEKLMYLKNSKITQKQIGKYRSIKKYIDEHQNVSEVTTDAPQYMPSSFLGSESHYRKLFYNCMHVATKIHNPDLFITMSANTKWEEITNNLKFYENSHDRPDIVDREFKLKLDSLLDDICNKGVLGHTVALCYAIGYQKRGLPHAHIVLFFDKDNRPKNIDEWDKLIWSYLPNLEQDPILFNLVTDLYLHGPCSAKYCVVNGKCKRHFPKKFENKTRMDENGNIIMKRSDDGSSTHKYINKKDNL